MPSGVVLIDKPTGMTSHDVVAQLRKKLSEKKIGHAGTLDPFASGLLVMGIGSGTKLLHHLFGLDKQYLATIRLGQATTTDDLEGDVVSEASAKSVSMEQIKEEIKNLTGSIQQVPSSVSAIKIQGKRAYDLVRAGEEVVIPARSVEVYHFQPTSELRMVGDFVEFDVTVDCSSGTYIRALARDLGTALGVGGHLRALRRTRIGEFSIADATSIESVGDFKPLLDVARKLFPVVELSSSQAQDIVHGKRLTLENDGNLAASFEGKLLAILEPVAKSYRSITVFPEAFVG
ncbi:MAG: tRNA pseudouridine(55) synthase TruB [Actinomycetota bacterium]